MSASQASDPFRFKSTPAMPASYAPSLVREVASEKESLPRLAAPTKAAATPRRAVQIEAIHFPHIIKQVQRPPRRKPKKHKRRRVASTEKIIEAQQQASEIAAEASYNATIAVVNAAKKVSAALLLLKVRQDYQSRQKEQILKNANEFAQKYVQRLHIPIRSPSPSPQDVVEQVTNKIDELETSADVAASDQIVQKDVRQMMKEEAQKVAMIAQEREKRRKLKLQHVKQLKKQEKLRLKQKKKKERSDKEEKKRKHREAADLEREKYLAERRQHDTKLRIAKQSYHGAAQTQNNSDSLVGKDLSGGCPAASSELNSEGNLEVLPAAPGRASQEAANTSHEGAAAVNPPADLVSKPKGNGTEEAEAAAASFSLAKPSKPPPKQQLVDVGRGRRLSVVVGDDDMKDIRKSMKQRLKQPSPPSSQSSAKTESVPQGQQEEEKVEERETMPLNAKEPKLMDVGGGRRLSVVVADDAVADLRLSMKKAVQAGRTEPAQVVTKEVQAAELTGSGEEELHVPEPRLGSVEKQIIQICLADKLGQYAPVERTVTEILERELVEMEKELIRICLDAEAASKARRPAKMAAAIAKSSALAARQLFTAADDAVLAANEKQKQEAAVAAAMAAVAAINAGASQKELIDAATAAVAALAAELKQQQENAANAAAIAAFAATSAALTSDLRQTAAAAASAAAFVQLEQAAEAAAAAAAAATRQKEFEVAAAAAASAKEKQEKEAAAAALAATKSQKEIESAATAAAAAKTEEEAAAAAAAIAAAKQRQEKDRAAAVEAALKRQWEAEAAELVAAALKQQLEQEAAAAEEAAAKRQKEVEAASAAAAVAKRNQFSEAEFAAQRQEAMRAAAAAAAAKRKREEEEEAAAAAAAAAAEAAAEQKQEEEEAAAAAAAATAAGVATTLAGVAAAVAGAAAVAAEETVEGVAAAAVRWQRGAELMLGDSNSGGTADFAGSGLARIVAVVVKLQSIYRASAVRWALHRLVTAQMNLQGDLMAMPDTAYGERGWYQYEGRVFYFEKDADGGFVQSKDPSRRPCTELQWRHRRARERMIAVRAVVRVQAWSRRRQARRALALAMNAHGKMLAMPGTVQGESGWYQKGEVSAKFIKNGDDWQLDPCSEPIQL